MDIYLLTKHLEVEATRLERTDGISILWRILLFSIIETTSCKHDIYQTLFTSQIYLSWEAVIKLISAALSLDYRADQIASSLKRFSSGSYFNGGKSIELLSGKLNFLDSIEVRSFGFGSVMRRGFSVCYFTWFILSR